MDSVLTGFEVAPVTPSQPTCQEKQYREEQGKDEQQEEDNDDEDDATTPSVSSSNASTSSSFSGPLRSQSAPGDASSVATPFRQLSHQQAITVSQYAHVPRSASSTTSSEPPLDFYTDSLDGFSSSESVISASSASTSAVSRSTSPNTKSAFPSSFYYSPSGSASSPSLLSYSQNWTPYHQHHLGPLTLPPPSLELPTTPSISTPTSSSAKGKGKQLYSSCPPSDGKPSPAVSGRDSVAASPDYSDLASSDTYRAPGSPFTDEDGSPFDDTLLQPPNNFAMVCNDVYRSSFPSRKHYPFLKSLGLKTVLTLVQDDYSPENAEFFSAEGIKFVQVGIPANKEENFKIPDHKIRNALKVVLDKRNHPMLIHCNKGKHRTGCLVGCLRKMQSWSPTSIFEEYQKFSFPKSRAMDQLFIELFQPEWEDIIAENLPDWCQRRRLPQDTSSLVAVTAKTDLDISKAESIIAEDGTESAGQSVTHSEPPIATATVVKDVDR